MNEPIIQHAICDLCHRMTVVSDQQEADAWLRSHRCSLTCNDAWRGDGEKHVCVRMRDHFSGGTDHKCTCKKKWG